jgi:hypothetical protein
MRIIFYYADNGGLLGWFRNGKSGAAVIQVLPQ